MTTIDYPPIQHIQGTVWVPETARPFVVGDRVRVRLSGECTTNGRQYNSRTGEIGISYQRHIPEEDGKTGTVIERPSYMAPAQRHYVSVEFDAVFSAGGFKRIVAATYAPAELELIQEAPR